MLTVKKFRFTFSFFLAVLILVACEGDNPSPSLGSIKFVEGIRVIDVGNDGNAGDVVLLFTIQNPGSAEQVQIFISKGPGLSLFDREDVENLSPDRLFTLDLSNTSYDISLPASLRDMEGNALEKNIEYAVGFLVSKEGEKFLNEESGLLSLTEEHYLNGNYTGTWDDNIYTSFGISARISLRLSGTRAGGDFFYSRNFSSCCQGDNDGTISFILKENGSIEDFIYRQVLANFMGGACPGTYNGSGEIENYTTLLINFEGEDCEGPHTNGRIRLKKQE